MTYNHAPYIVEAMNGFTIQQTKFPFVCAILDDASIDGEPEVIRDYLEMYFDLEDKTVVQNIETDDYLLTFARHKINKNCYFAVFFLKYNHYRIMKSKLPYITEWNDSAKYIAICEGDDYWIDPMKLQKQVDIMESNNDVGLVYGKSKQYDESKRKFLIKTLGADVQSPAALLLNNTIPTATILMRSSIYNDYIKDHEIQEKQWLMGDYPLWVYCAISSRIVYVDDLLAVYRLLKESASHSNTDRKRMENFYESATQMKLYFNNRYHLVETDKIYSQHHELLLFNAATYGDRGSVIFHYPLIKQPSSISKVLYFLAKTRSLFIYNMYKRLR